MLTLNESMPISKVTLPICETPLLQNSMDAIALSVLQADGRNLLPLICHSYLNIQKGRCDYTVYSHIYDDLWLVQSKAMVQHQTTLYKGNYQDKTDELLNLIFTFLSKGYYLTGEINGKYLLTSFEYHLYDTNRPYLIYGYDLEDRVFFAAGKTKKKYFGTFRLSFDEYLNGIFETKLATFSLTFIKANDEISNIEPNYGKLYNGIVDYLHSKNRFDGLFADCEAAYCIFGMDCYKDFYHKIQYVHEYEQYIEPLHYQIFLEHHKVIRELMKYLVDQCDMDLSILLKEYSEEIYARSEQIYDMCISYNRQNDPVLLKNILDNIDYIIKHEPMILQQLLDVLKEKVKQLKAKKNKT